VERQEVIVVVGREKEVGGLKRTTKVAGGLYVYCGG
jgi:hypothetical protein